MVEIVSYNSTSALEEKTKEGNGKIFVGIDEMSITYVQPADTCSSSEDVQTLKITTRQGCASTEQEVNDQEGYYFDVEIPEGHWSVSDGDELAEIVEDFKKRLYMTTNKNE